MFESLSIAGQAFSIRQNAGGSAGLDGIKLNLLKNLPDMGNEMLLEIYNQIFFAGTCPESWQETKVISILTPGKEPNNANFYRSISLLLCVRKLFEKMICTRLDYWAEKFETLSPSRFGFRKGRGTRDCLSLLSSDTRISFEQKKKTLAAFLDTSGAYDNLLIDVLCGN
jgi:hypothetical protein